MALCRLWTSHNCCVPARPRPWQKRIRYRNQNQRCPLWSYARTVPSGNVVQQSKPHRGMDRVRRWSCRLNGHLDGDRSVTLVVWRLYVRANTHGGMDL